MTYGKRPARCHNCGAWIIRAYSGQTVCCVNWQGPRWIDDPQGAERHKAYREWIKRLSEEKTR